jgi:hypothetical protein
VSRGQRGGSPTVVNRHFIRLPHFNDDTETVRKDLLYNISFGLTSPMKQVWIIRLSESPGFIQDRQKRRMASSGMLHRVAPV